MRWNRNSPWLRAILALAATLATLLAVELGLRIRYSTDRNQLEKAFRKLPPKRTNELRLIHLIQPSPNERLIYELRPGVEGQFSGAAVSINSAGMRDSEVLRRKSQKSFRIAVIGDSCAFGQGIESPDTLSETLESFLNRYCAESGRRYEVLNFGVPGYNTALEAELFQTRVLDYEPDAVVLEYVGNDTELPNFIPSENDSWTLRRSFLFDLVFSVLQARKGQQKMRPDFGLRILTMPERKISADAGKNSWIPEKYRALVGWQTVATSFKVMAKQGRNLSIPMVILCHFHDVDESLETDPDQVSHLSNEVYRTAAESGWIAANPLELQVRYLEETGQDENIFWLKPNKDPHPNALLNRLYALCIYRALAGTEKIPRGIVDSDLSVTRQLVFFDAKAQGEM